MIKNILTRRKESDTYLTLVYRHRWSRQITKKVDTFPELSASTVAFISSRYFLSFHLSRFSFYINIHIHLLSSDQERHLWLAKHISEASVCFCVPFIQRYLPFFLFFSLFLCYPYFCTLSFHGIYLLTVKRSPGDCRWI